MSAHQRQPSAAAVAALRDGELTVVGRIVESSNYTFLVEVVHEGATTKAIYKPFEGEEPLWDFPEGLYRREVAAYELSIALGWPNIPETVVRDDAPFGVGSLQRFIDADFEQHYFTFGEAPELQDDLRAMCVFDIVANNTDRKGGHCLLDEEARVWGIDHGLTFHPEPKLRTVIWEFGGEPMPAALLEDLARVQESLPDALLTLLTEEERTALGERIQTVLDDPVFPEPVTQRQFPWPLV